MTDHKIIVEMDRGGTWFDPSRDEFFDLTSELNRRHRFLRAWRLDATDSVQVYLAEDYSRFEIEYRQRDPDTHLHVDVDRDDDCAAQGAAATVFAGWASGRDDWRTLLPWQPCDPPWSCADREARQADLSEYEGYAYDMQSIDGVEYIVVGVEDRATGTEVVKARYLPPTGPQRGPLTVHLAHRATDLPIERAAELLRSTAFHDHANHYYCARVAAYDVRDDGGAHHTLAQDRC